MVHAGRKLEACVVGERAGQVLQFDVQREPLSLEHELQFLDWHEKVGLDLQNLDYSSDDTIVHFLILIW